MSVIGREMKSIKSGLCGDFSPSGWMQVLQ